MKINSICELIKAYNAIFNFFIDTGVGELVDLTPHATLNHFIDSYREFDSLLSYWEELGWKDIRNCSEEIKI